MPEKQQKQQQKQQLAARQHQRHPQLAGSTPLALGTRQTRIGITTSTAQAAIALRFCSSQGDNNNNHCDYGDDYDDDNNSAGQRAAAAAPTPTTPTVARCNRPSKSCQIETKPRDLYDCTNYRISSNQNIEPTLYIDSSVKMEMYLIDENNNNSGDLFGLHKQQVMQQSQQQQQQEPQLQLQSQHHLHQLEPQQHQQQQVVVVVSATNNANSNSNSNSSSSSTSTSSKKTSASGTNNTTASMAAGIKIEQNGSSQLQRAANGSATQSGPKPRGRRRKIRTEPIRPICPQCEKQFSNQSALTKHKLTHSDERRFACQQCSKAFKRHDHLTGHMQTHSNRKPFNCTIQGCDKTYCDARSLRRHKENIHHIVTPKESATSAAHSHHLNGSSHLNNSNSSSNNINNSSNNISHQHNNQHQDHHNHQHRQPPPAPLQLQSMPQQTLVMTTNGSNQQFEHNQQHYQQHQHQLPPQPLSASAVTSTTGGEPSTGYNSSASINGDYATPAPLMSAGYHTSHGHSHHHHHQAPYSADYATTQHFTFDQPQIQQVGCNTTTSVNPVTASHHHDHLHHQNQAPFSADYASTQHFSFDFNHHPHHVGGDTSSITDSGLGLNVHYEQQCGQPHISSTSSIGSSSSAGYLTPCGHLSSNFTSPSDHRPPAQQQDATTNSNTASARSNSANSNVYPVSTTNFTSLNNNQHQASHLLRRRIQRLHSDPGGQGIVVEDLNCRLPESNWRSVDLNQQQHTPLTPQQQQQQPPTPIYGPDNQIHQQSQHTNHQQQQQHQAPYSADYATTQHFTFDQPQIQQVGCNTTTSVNPVSAPHHHDHLHHQNQAPFSADYASTQHFSFDFNHHPHHVGGDAGSITGGGPYE